MVNTLIAPTGKVCSTNEEKTDLLFHTTCVAPAPCRIEETDIIKTPISDETRTTEKVMSDFLQYLTEENIKSVVYKSPPPPSKHQELT